MVNDYEQDIPNDVRRRLERSYVPESRQANHNVSTARLRVFRVVPTIVI